MKFKNSFRTLPSFFYEDVVPTPINNAKLIHATDRRKNIHLNDDELRQWLNGQMKLEGEQRLASRYAGHQFGVWAGQLGDGRAISLGEIQTADGKFEIQTKGSGLTPFSRMGDGKAVIRSSVREYLCSEAMHGLNIPTTRVLALLTGEDDVYRETIERSALIARVFPTNLRFGHFEMAFHFDKKNELDALIEYTRSEFFSDLSTSQMLQEIVTQTAKLMAKWQSVGFCHGVMNTDNMSILGLTIDYGPFGFLEDTHLSHVCNHSDHQGRYAYHRQPTIAQWNLERLLVCFIHHVPREELQKILNSFAPTFEQEFTQLCREKLGLQSNLPQDLALFIELIQILDQLSIDYTYFFRSLSRYTKEDKEFNGLWDYYGKRQELIQWLQKYQERLALEDCPDDLRHISMLKVNPKYILRNYIAQEVIESVEKGESESLAKWLKIFYSPFEEHAEFEHYARPTPPEKKNFIVSCSS
ncbi:MAG: YdiU family protein [Bacteriovoracaceae bacterium]